MREAVQTRLTGQKKEGTSVAEQRQESKLIRNIGFWGLMGIAVGQIIGAGIMTMTGIAIGMTGTGVALAYIISALLTLFTNYPTAVLGACVPTTGGQYRYISRLWGKELGFVFLVTYIISNLTIALYALSFASYMVSLVSGVSETLVAAAILIFFYVVNMVGAKEAALLNTLISAALIAGIMAFILFGVGKTDFGYVFDPSNMFANGPMAFVSATALLSFATGGASVISQMGGEVLEPHKNIPKVIVISTIFVGVLYAFIATIAAGVLPIDQVAGQNLSLVAREIMPGWAFVFFVIAAAGGATTSTLNATLSWVSKPILVACDDGILPKAMGKVSNKGVPTVILTMFFIIGMVPIVTKVDISIISTVGTAISLFSTVIFCLAFIKLPEKYPKELAASPLKLSNGGIKALGIGAMIVSLALSYSLAITLPLPAVIAFLVIVALSAVYAYGGGLKKVVIPDDLAVDYSMTQEQADMQNSKA